MTENNRILVIDDDPGVRETYRSILSPRETSGVLARGAALFGTPDSVPAPAEERQYELHLAENGQAGVALVDDRKTALPFAAAFIDMKMPGMNGAETARQIWEIDPDMRIVIVTAYSEHTPDDIVRISGRDDIFYLRKPFNPEEIRQFARALTNEWNMDRRQQILTEKLETANARLEEINLTLTDQVARQAAMIVQSEKMASIGILAAGVAHEINNPIAYVHGNLATIQKYVSRIRGLIRQYDRAAIYMEQRDMEAAVGVLADVKAFRKEQKIDYIMEDIVDLAHESLEGTTRVKNIVLDLKTFSRVDQAEYQPVQINETIDATLNIIANEVKCKAEVIRDYGDLPEVSCYSQKISQVFMNLILNAAQAIGENGIIRIRTRLVTLGRRHDDTYVEVSVSDTGCGIPKQDLKRLFDPFFTTKPVGQGTGLGLSIAYDIIKAHGGTLTVESEEGRGSAFTVRLPVSPNRQSGNGPVTP